MATLDEVAERFALDQVFADYPHDGTIAQLEDVANSVNIFTDADDWLLCAEFEELAYVSADAILQVVYDNVWAFKRYYEMVDEH